MDNFQNTLIGIIICLFRIVKDFYNDILWCYFIFLKKEKNMVIQVFMIEGYFGFAIVGFIAIR